MIISDFFHFMDQWHRAARNGPCEPDSQGLVEFTTPGEVACAARLLPSGEIELFASPGYAGADLIRAVMEEDEWQDDMDFGAPSPWMDWHADGFEWSLGIRVTDGLVVLTRVGAAPTSEQQWDEGLGRFDAAYAQWDAKLLAEPDMSVGGSRP
jgi:hypothetical protein